MVVHGAFYWNELLTTDVEAATAFYSRVLGWRNEKMPMEHGGEYTVVLTATGPAGGIMNIAQTGAPQGTPSHWYAYIAVDDIDAAVERVSEAGGTVTTPPFEVPGVGRIAIITDPTGASVGIMTPTPAGPEAA